MHRAEPSVQNDCALGASHGIAMWITYIILLYVRDM